MEFIHPGSKKRKIGVRLVPGVLLADGDVCRVGTSDVWEACPYSRIGSPVQLDEDIVWVRGAPEAAKANVLIAYMAVTRGPQFVIKDPEGTWAFGVTSTAFYGGIKPLSVTKAQQVAYVRHAECLGILAGAGHLNHRYAPVEYYQLTAAGMVEGRRIFQEFRQSAYLPDTN